MTEDQKEFLELVKRFEDLKATYKELKANLHESAENLGIGTHFQDPITKAVYHIIQPVGTYISFDAIGYERTRLPDEKKGSLSLKKAEEFGYSLK